MIRLTALLRRNPVLTAEEFHAHWRDVHAAKVRSVPGVAEWVVRYEQHPRVPDEAGRWTGSEGYEGMAVQWFRDLDAFGAMLADPEYRRVVAPDERYLLDLRRSAFLLTHEPRVVIGSPGEGAAP